jgi:hypothetical protein
MTLMTRATLAALVALAGVPALAIEPIGTIDGTLNGESRTWRTLGAGENNEATATIQRFGPVSTLSIQGHDPNSDAMMRGVLTINTGVMGSETATELMDTSVGYFPQGMGRAFYIADEEAGSIELLFDQADFQEDGVVGGTVSAELCLKTGIFASADEEDCIHLKVRFETQLQSVG